MRDAVLHGPCRTLRSLTKFQTVEIWRYGKTVDKLKFTSQEKKPKKFGRIHLAKMYNPYFS